MKDDCPATSCSSSELRTVCSFYIKMEVTFPGKRITLLENEKKIFKHMLDCIGTSGISDTVLRVAGGWVRDKLLGIESDDIDIVLNNMSGFEFASMLHKHLSETTTCLISSSVGKIQANPEQSKHLETATLKIDENWIDFVKLRRETYAEKSRIPVVEFGTPKDDAFRRDLTINALFYNINSGLIEDWTKEGLSDLKEKKCNTPQKPHITFNEDPLRILRVVRFATRLDFTLDPDIYIAASDPVIQNLLETKISRERLGIEITKMFENSPYKAISTLNAMKLLPHIFTFPSEKDIFHTDNDERLKTHEYTWSAILPNCNQLHFIHYKIHNLTSNLEYFDYYSELNRKHHLYFEDEVGGDIPWINEKSIYLVL